MRREISQFDSTEKLIAIIIAATDLIGEFNAVAYINAMEELKEVEERLLISSFPEKEKLLKAVDLIKTSLIRIVDRINIVRSC